MTKFREGIKKTKSFPGKGEELEKEGGDEERISTYEAKEIVSKQGRKEVI